MIKNKGKLKVHFLGAAGTVTGSKFLIDTGERRIMVDCGLFQGLKKLRLLNWDYLPVNVNDIDCVLLTHGHLDHTGFLPKLVKMGFRGEIYGTRPTLDIARIILEDSARIQMEEAEKANKEGYSKHSPAVPLYDMEDAQRTYSHFRNIRIEEWINLYEGIKVRFRYVGHIIGATYIEMDIHGKRLVFSGDVGRKDDFLLQPPVKPDRADFLFIESTYGDRLHPREDLLEKLREIIAHTIKRGGTLFIPSFAVERAQLLMYLLWKLKSSGAIPSVPMILDSPMGANMLSVFQDHHDWHKIPIEDCVEMCKAFRIVKEYTETWEIINTQIPKIIIAGSGMVSGGRILTYLTKYLEKPETTVLLAGFQAEGTRGRKLLDGTPDLKIYGKYYQVKAEIQIMEALSAHADQEELLDWVSDISGKPEQVYIIHGEPHSADTFRLRLNDKLGWECTIPELYEIFEL